MRGKKEKCFRSSKNPEYGTMWRSSPSSLSTLVGVHFAVRNAESLTSTAGIAWIAVEGAPILFETIGLGLGTQPG